MLRSDDGSGGGFGSYQVINPGTGGLQTLIPQQGWGNPVPGVTTPGSIAQPTPGYSTPTYSAPPPTFTPAPYQAPPVSMRNPAESAPAQPTTPTNPAPQAPSAPPPGPSAPSAPSGGFSMNKLGGGLASQGANSSYWGGAPGYESQLYGNMYSMNPGGVPSASYLGGMNAGNPATQMTQSTLPNYFQGNLSGSPTPDTGVMNTGVAGVNLAALRFSPAQMGNMRGM